MSIAFTFPGQGAQVPDMLQRLPQHWAVRQTLEEACTVLACHSTALDNAQALRSTQAVQLCLLIAGVASARMLSAEGCEADMVLGLSIGAYPAAVVAGALEFADALSLVRLRGQLMQDAFPSGYGMAAIIGLDRFQIEVLVGQISTPEHPVFVANLNGAEQIVVSGHELGLRAIMDAALAAHAKKAVRLAISVPSHCALLDAAAARMASALADVSLTRPRITYISASRARALFSPELIAEDLAFNMARQVHWDDAASLASERGMHLAIEMLPGVVLSPLTRSVMPCGAEALALQNARLDTLLELSRRERAAQR